MTIDPSVMKILELIKATGMPDFEKMDIKDVRKMMDELFTQKNVEEVLSVKDLSFVHHGIAIPMRLYVPKNAGKGLIIYLHGGAWVLGNIKSYDSVCRKAANASGTKVLCVEYRLAPEYKFPAAVEDAYESYLWARNNASSLEIDPEKIAIAGDSAGGNLATAVCLMAKDRNIPMPKLQVLFYPALGPDFFTESLREYGEGYFLEMKQMGFILNAYLRTWQDILNPYFSPILYRDHSGLPEAIIVTAEYDPLRDQGEMYLSTLYRAGVQATGIRARGMIHGFLNFYTIVPAAENITVMAFSLCGQKIK